MHKYFFLQPFFNTIVLTLVVHYFDQLKVELFFMFCIHVMFLITGGRLIFSKYNSLLACRLVTRKNFLRPPPTVSFQFMRNNTFRRILFMGQIWLVLTIPQNRPKCWHTTSDLPSKNYSKKCTKQTSIKRSPWIQSVGAATKWVKQKNIALNIKRR